jgi:hypothetical protein
MSSDASPLDVDALMRDINPSTETPAPEAVEAALQRMLAEAALREQGVPAERIGRRRLRLALAGVVLAAAVAAFLVINLLPSSGTPAGVGKAWARDVVARSAAVAAGRGDGILHIDVLMTQTSAGGGAPVRYRVESWSQLRAPHGYWETTVSGTDETTTTVIGNQIETYDSRTKTLSGATKQIGRAVPRATLFDPAYHAALTVLYPRDGAGAGHVPRSLPQLIARLIRSPGVAVDRTARIDGRQAISLTSLRGRAILYVEPRTYAPIEFVMHGDPGAVNPVTIRMRFLAYETLARGSVQPPDLQRLHPGARYVIGVPG